VKGIDDLINGKKINGVREKRKGTERK